MKVYMIRTLVKIGLDGFSIRYENVAVVVTRRTFLKYKKKFSCDVQDEYNQSIIYVPASGLSRAILARVYYLADNYTNSLD